MFDLAHAYIQGEGMRHYAKKVQQPEFAVAGSTAEYRLDYAPAAEQRRDGAVSAADSAGQNGGRALYAIGCQKHGKTECYREYLHYLARGQEDFTVAPRVCSMVMLVFTRPKLGHVFKVIKDRFAPQKKEVTDAQVRACYRLVKEHNRVGRMADTQEFEYFALPRAHSGGARKWRCGMTW